MSRAAVLSALRSDTQLTALVPQENIMTNYSKEGRPSNTSPGAFIILRWEEVSTNPGVSSVTRVLTVWAHYPAESSTDYSKIDSILLRVKKILVGMEHVSGQDGYTVTCVDYNGESSDLKDDAFNTISRNSTFRVLSRATSIVS